METAPATAAPATTVVIALAPQRGGEEKRGRITTPLGRFFDFRIKTQGHALLYGLIANHEIGPEHDPRALHDAIDDLPLD